MQGMFGASLSLPVVELSMRIVAKFRACAQLFGEVSCECEEVRSRMAGVKRKLDEFDVSEVADSNTECANVVVHGVVTGWGRHTKCTLLC